MVHGITAHNFETRHPSDDSDQVWFPFVLYVQRRRFLKSLRRTTDDDDRCQVMAITHMTLRVRWAKNYVVPFTWIIYISKKNNIIWAFENSGPLYNTFSTKHIFFHMLMRFISLSVFGAKYQEQFNMFEKLNCKRTWVNDEWKCLILLI